MMIGALGDWRSAGPIVALALRCAPDPAFDHIRDVLFESARGHCIPVFESAESALRGFNPLLGRRGVARLHYLGSSHAADQ